MTAARLLVQLIVFTLPLSYAAENPCGTQVKPEKKEESIFKNPAVLGGTIAGALGAAVAVGAGVGVGVHNSQEAAEAAAKAQLRAREAKNDNKSPPCKNGTTNLSAPVEPKHGRIMAVCIAGFAAGDNIKIGGDSEDAEYNIVKQVGPTFFILKDGVANTWAAGTLVEKVAADAVPGRDWKLWLGLGLVAAGLLVCAIALACMFCGKKTKRAKKSKKVTPAPVPEAEVEFEIAPLLPMLVPTTGYQQMQMPITTAAPMTTSYAYEQAAPVYTGYQQMAAPMTTSYAYEQAAPVYAAAPQYQYSAAPQYAAAPMMTGTTAWEVAGAQ